MKRRDSVRPEKPRRNKPCDLCRQKELLCDLSGDPSCLRCQKSTQPCVFVQRQVKRARQKSSQSWPSILVADGVINDDRRLMSSFDRSDDDTSRTNVEVRSCGFNVSTEQPTTQYTTSCFTNNNESVSPLRSSPSTDHEVQTENRQTTAALFGSASGNETTKRSTLENIPGAFSFYIGPTGVSDVHLLLRQLHDVGDISLDIAKGLNVRTVDQTPGDQLQKSTSAPVIFGVTDKTLVETVELRAVESDLERIEAEFWNLLSRKSAYHLVCLYIRFVEPCFSIFSLDQIPGTIDGIDNLSLALLAGICATSLPFALHEDALYPILPSLPKSERL